MESILSYSSSDSDGDTYDLKDQGGMVVATKGPLSKAENDTTHRKHCFPNQNAVNQKHLAASSRSNSGHPFPSASLQNSVCVMSSTDKNLQNKSSVKVLKHWVSKDNVLSGSGDNTVKPYIPKSKRLKLLNESEELDVGHHDDSSSNLKLSIIFQKAKAFSPKCLHYRVPKGQTNAYEAHDSCVNRIAWNPCFEDFLLSASMDNVVKVWNVQTTPCCVYHVHSHQQAVKDAKWSSNGLQILSCGYDKIARITDINMGKEICGLRHNSFVTSVLYHPSDHNVILSGTSNNGILAWDIRMQQVICKYKSFFGQIQDLAFLSNRESFISAAEILKRNSTDKGIMVWDYKTSTILSNQVFQEAYTCTALQIHPTENTFLAQCNAGYIAVFSQKSPYKLNKYKRFEGHLVSGYHIGLDISPDGTLVASGSAEGTIFVYSYHTSNLLKQLPSHSQPCMDVAWSPTIPSLLASCDWNGKITLHR